MGTQSFAMSFTFKLPKGGGFQNRSQHPISPSPEFTCEQRAKQPKPRNNPKAKSAVRTIHDRYHNPDPSLLDSGAQITTITISQARKMELKIKSLDQFIDIEGSGGISVPYIGYVEANLKISEIKAYEKDLLMMVMNDSRYGDQVPFAIATKHTQAALEVITKKEWAELGESWRCAPLPACTAKVSEIEYFNLNTLQGNVKVHTTAILPPLSTTFEKGRSKVKGHHKRVNVATEHSDNSTNSNIAVVRSYSFIKPGSNKVLVSIKKLTRKEIVL